MTISTVIHHRRRGAKEFMQRVERHKSVVRACIRLKIDPKARMPRGGWKLVADLINESDPSANWVADTLRNADFHAKSDTAVVLCIDAWLARQLEWHGILT